MVTQGEGSAHQHESANRTLDVYSGHTYPPWLGAAKVPNIDMYRNVNLSNYHTTIAIGGSTLCMA